MADDRTFEFNADLQGLQGDAIIDLWTLDLQPIDPTVAPADRFIRFCNWVVADGQAVSFASQVYTAIPYKAQGFTYQTEGVPPSPSLTISNIGLEFTALVNEWNDLIGAQLTRTRVLARHLDGGTDPDGDAHWPEETWYIQQKESENKLLVTFKLSTAFDLDGVLLPRRRALRYTCPWIYRGDGCDYAGSNFFNAEDEPVADEADDVCGKRLTSCQLRFEDVDLPFGGFPGLSLQ
jgi:lambda family phage minor tail protein L